MGAAPPAAGRHLDRFLLLLATGSSLVAEGLRLSPAAGGSQALPLLHFADPLYTKWEAPGWVNFFALLGPDFPAAEAQKEDWRNFLKSCSIGPIVLLLVGVIAAVGTLVCSSTCCQGRKRITIVHEAPARLPVLTFGSLAVVLAAAGAVAYWGTGGRAVGASAHQFASLVTDVGAVEWQGTSAQQALLAMSKELDNVAPKCPANLQSLVSSRVTPIQEEAAAISAELLDYLRQLAPVDDELKTVSSRVTGGANIVTLALLVPLALVFLCALIAATTAACAQTGQRTGCMLRSLGPALFAPCVLVVTLATSAQLAVGVVTGSFCQQVDTNILTHAGALLGTDTAEYQAMRYYLTAQGSNPVMEKINDAEQKLRDAKIKLRDAQSFLSTQCPAWTGAGWVTYDVYQVQQALDTIQRYLMPNYVYPYYTKAARENVCTTLVAGLGWLVTFQTAAGLIGLPLLLWAVHHFLRRKTAWYRAQELAPEKP